MTPRLCVWLAAFFVFLACLAPAAEPIDRAELEALRARVRELETQLKVIAQRLDGQPAPDAAPSPISPSGTFSVPGRRNPSGRLDPESLIRLRGLVQLDTRAFFQDGDAATDTFTLRRARLMTDATLARRYGFQFVTEFGGNDFSVRDASLTARLADSVQLKAGKFKPPFGMEVLQQGHVRPMIERSLVSNLVPIRDVGLQLGGAFLDERVDYAVGVFNGVGDGGVADNADRDEPKELAARIMWSPFGQTPAEHPRLTLGIAATRGRHRTPAGHLPVYRTDGQQTFLAYGPSVFADGKVFRLSPQFDYRTGPLGVTGEWVISSIGVHAQPGTAATRLSHHAWQLTSSYVLTGENSSFYGIVPQADFAPAAGAWGAFELVARYAGVRIDDATFPLFASPDTVPAEVGALGLGLNWHLSRTVRFMFNYSQAEFDLAAGSLAATPLLRNGEKVFASRLQLAF